jgi:hypothetical protein
MRNDGSEAVEILGRAGANVETDLIPLQTVKRNLEKRWCIQIEQ